MPGPHRTLLAVPLVLATLAAVLPLTAARGASGATTSAAATFEAVGRPVPRVLRASGVDLAVSPGRQAALRANVVSGPVTSTFQVTYTGFTAQQQAAFQLAVDIWSRIVVSSVPITIDARLDALEQGVLGSAGPDNAFRSNGSYFAVALANSIAGQDLDAGNPDIDADFTNDSSLIYYGTDANPPSGKYDFPTIVLHEIGHGLGFLGNLEVVNGIGTYDSGAGTPTPFSYDRFVVQQAPSGPTTTVLSLPRGSAAMADALQSNALFWDGSGAMAAGSGTRPRLYAPPTWEPGSSLGHLNEATYPAGTANALMTPIADAREISRDPGPLALGMLEDTGWQLSAAADPTPSPSPSAAPASTPAPTPTTSPAAAPTTSPTAAPTGTGTPTSTPSSTPTSSFAPTPQPSPTGTVAAGSRFTALAPRRLLDTRDGTGASTGRVGAGGVVRLAVTGGSTGVPSDATAVVLNVTGVAATASTDVRVYPAGSGRVPTVSNLNLTAGQTRANLVTVAIGPDGAVLLRNNSGNVHLLADLAGFYSPAASSTYFPLDPRRLLDTRSGGGPVGAGRVRDLRVAGSADVPPDAVAVVLSVTAVGATRSSDVRVYPTPAGSSAVPLVSTLNVVPGGPVPNLVIVAVGDNGSVRLRNNSGSVHLLADVAGYYAPSSAGALFRPLDPSRVLDTRPQRLGAGQVLDLNASGAVPAGATALALNITGVGASASTDVRLYPTPLASADGPPAVSILNLVPGQTAADAAIVRTGNGGSVRLYNNAGSVALLADVAGWFGP